MSAYRKLLDRYVECYNAGDLDGVMELYAEDATQRMPNGVFEGKSAIRDRLAQELDACPDAYHRVESYIEQGDMFADEWTFVGTQTGAFPLPDGTELPPSGRRVEVRGMEVVIMRDGKIIANNLYYDLVGVLAQFGVGAEAVVA